MSTDSPELPSLAGGSTTPQLGSLAQSAREKSLRNARTYLIVIGLITAVVNAFMVYRMPEEVHQEVAKLQAKGQLIDRQAVEAAVRAGQVMAGAFVLLGIVFVALGITVKSYPVPITITAFVLYVGAAVVMALLDPESLARGFIIKIIVVIALLKSIQAAVAYQRELNATSAPTLS